MIDWGESQGQNYMLSLFIPRPTNAFKKTQSVLVLLFLSDREIEICIRPYQLLHNPLLFPYLQEWIDSLSWWPPATSTYSSSIPDICWTQQLDNKVQQENILLDTQAAGNAGPSLNGAGSLVTTDVEKTKALTVFFTFLFTGQSSLQ